MFDKVLDTFLDDETYFCHQFLLFENGAPKEGARLPRTKLFLLRQAWITDQNKTNFSRKK